MIKRLEQLQRARASHGEIFKALSKAREPQRKILADLAKVRAHHSKSFDVWANNRPRLPEGTHGSP